MNGQKHQLVGLAAEPELVRMLGRVCSSSDEQLSQQRANTLLAHMAWSRITEPGDGTAGGLLHVLGAEQALGMLVRGITAHQLRSVAKAAGLEISARAADEALGRWLPRLNRNATIADIERAVAVGLRVVLPGDAAWPTSLNDLELHAPVMLWVRGELACLSALSLGVVGARAATAYGSHITAEIVDGVCAAGINIISGAAYGIDAVAHRTALAVGMSTVAVVAGGADRPYPQSHAQLFDRISKSGAVCSEMVPGSAPTKWRFLMRNRLIAALSRGILVAEAGVNSGSLNTAGHAAQLGRPIGAVPGPITSAASAGCHRLLREYDAMIVTNSREACELIGVNDELLVVDSTGETLDRDSAWHRRVLDAIPLKGGRELTDIARRSGLTAEQTASVIAELELLGRVKRQSSPGGAPPKWALAR